MYIQADSLILILCTLVHAAVLRILARSVADSGRDGVAKFNARSSLDVRSQHAVVDAAGGGVSGQQDQSLESTPDCICKAQTRGGRKDTRVEQPRACAVDGRVARVDADNVQGDAALARRVDWLRVCENASVVVVARGKRRGKRQGAFDSFEIKVYAKARDGGRQRAQIVLVHVLVRVQEEDVRALRGQGRKTEVEAVVARLHDNHEGRV